MAVLSSFCCHSPITSWGAWCNRTYFTAVNPALPLGIPFPRHRYLLGVGVPGVLLVCIGVPAWIFYVRKQLHLNDLRSTQSERALGWWKLISCSLSLSGIPAQMMTKLRNEDRLCKANVIQRYGFLFLGYDPVRTPWWCAAA